MVELTAPDPPGVPITLWHKSSFVSYMYFLLHSKTEAEKEAKEEVENEKPEPKVISTKMSEEDVCRCLMIN